MEEKGEGQSPEKARKGMTQESPSQDVSPHTILEDTEAKNGWSG